MDYKIDDLSLQKVNENYTGIIKEGRVQVSSTSRLIKFFCEENSKKVGCLQFLIYL